MILNQISIGKSGRILRPTGDSPEVKRLEELGFVEGAVVRLLRKGPMGSPLLFEICQTQIAIRREEAALFQVE